MADGLPASDQEERKRGGSKNVRICHGGFLLRGVARLASTGSFGRARGFLRSLSS